MSSVHPLSVQRWAGSRLLGEGEREGVIHPLKRVRAWFQQNLRRKSSVLEIWQMLIFWAPISPGPQPPQSGLNLLLYMGILIPSSTYAVRSDPGGGSECS